MDAKTLEEYEKRTTAMGLLNYTKEYYQGYETINASHPKDVDCMAVKYFLLCHSLELALKSWLRLKGLTYLELKSLGHNLEKCVKLLADKYDLHFDPVTTQMIIHTNQYYSNKDFEYFVMGYKSLPAINQLASSVHLIISKVNYDVTNDFRARRKS